jgi:hypothetical protein
MFDMTKIFIKNFSTKTDSIIRLRGEHNHEANPERIR